MGFLFHTMCWAPAFALSWCAQSGDNWPHSGRGELWRVVASCGELWRVVGPQLVFWGSGNDHGIHGGLSISI